MGGAVFPPCYLPGAKFTCYLPEVEVMKITVTSFKRSHACTAALSAPHPAAGHQGPTPLLETPSWEGLVVGKTKSCPGGQALAQ